MKPVEGAEKRDVGPPLRVEPVVLQLPMRIQTSIWPSTMGTRESDQLHELRERRRRFSADILNILTIQCLIQIRREQALMGVTQKDRFCPPGGSVIIITGPNENSQKASISVYVLAANSQDEVYEGTTRPRPEKRQANTKTRRRDE